MPNVYRLQMPLIPGSDAVKRPDARNTDDNEKDGPRQRNDGHYDTGGCHAGGLTDFRILLLAEYAQNQADDRYRYAAVRDDQ